MMPAAEEVAMLHPDDDLDEQFDLTQELEDDLTILQTHLESGDWEDAYLRLQTHPHEIYPLPQVHATVGRSFTALHVACENGECPMHLICAIMSVDPVLCILKDKDGNLPLHIACSGQYAYDPFIIACLLAAYPQGVRMVDELNGETPLHLLLRLGGDLDQHLIQTMVDLAGSRIADMPKDYIPWQALLSNGLGVTSVVIDDYPASLVAIVTKLAQHQPLLFPLTLTPFLLGSKSNVSPLVPYCNILLLQDKLQGHTPLHIAAQQVCSLEVFQLLMNEERYPGAREAAKIRDTRERFPLSYAACYGACHNTVDLLLESYPLSIYECESYQMIAFHLVFVGLFPTAEDRKLKVNSIRHEQSSAIKDFFDDPHTFEFWKQLAFLLKRTHQFLKQLDDRPQWNYIHAVGVVQSPPQVMRAALKLYPWQVREYDSNGNLALHLACQQQHRHGFDDLHYWLPSNVRRDKTLHLEPMDVSNDNPMSIILQAFPAAATCLDRRFSLPLHVAVYHGRQWNHGVQSLVGAAPDALLTRDGVHHLYPFMLAAVDECNSLDTVFRLLVANPSIVTQMLTEYDQSALNDQSPEKPFGTDFRETKRMKVGIKEIPPELNINTLN